LISPTGETETEDKWISLQLRKQRLKISGAVSNWRNRNRRPVEQFPTGETVTVEQWSRRKRGNRNCRPVEQSPTVEQWSSLHLEEEILKAGRRVADRPVRSKCMQGGVICRQL
jgi:hypothetical protein